MSEYKWWAPDETAVAWWYFLVIPVLLAVMLMFTWWTTAAYVRNECLKTVEPMYQRCIESPLSHPELCSRAVREEWCR
jgi:hypothetical protein